MAKKAATKESLKELSVQELEARLRESQEKSFRLKFQHASNPLKNPMEIRTARREIAKVMTVLRQKAKVS
jgi:large subunit ribosomal protein L29